MSPLLSTLAGVLALVGAIFALIAALGIVRFPDLLTRMHAATKAGTLGAGLLLLAVAVAFADAGVAARAAAGIAFLVLTAPVASHAIGRAAYFCGVRLWERTEVDELAGHYDPETHVLDPAEAELHERHEPVA
ncbi:MAG: monovalent cation/H(+) antiporter subunit G [Bacteroidota bacterium]